MDKYLSSWTREPALAQPTYTLEEGVMSLEIYEETRPWAEEYDGQTVVSGFTTGNRNGLHNWTKNNVVRNPVETEVTHINQYGYYEIRAKTQPGSSRHSAWWLTGFEDRPEHSAEIDIFEVLGNNKHGVPRAFHAWNDPSQPFSGGASTYTDPTADFHHEWHTYGFDWQEGTGAGEHPDRLVFYVDGKDIGAVNTKIDYPMIQLFSLYEKRAGGWTGPWEWMPYPNSFDIDYVRVYKKIPEENQALSASELEITQIHPSTVTVTEGEAELTTYTSFVLGEEGTEYVEPNLPNTLSYVDVEWNDGVVTQEFVKWDPITETDLAELNNGEGLTKRGRLVNLPENTPGLTEALLTVEVTEAPPLPPYSSINLGSQNDQTQLGKLFDGNYESNSGEFIFESNTLPENEEVSITYDFKQTVQLHTIELSTNYGNDQGIKAFQLAYYDAETDTWITLEDTYTVPWAPAGNSERGETLVVEVSVPETTQVKMILTDVGLRWVNKMAMRELSFADHDVILDWIALQTLINEADPYTPDGYTETSFASFTDVLNDAKALLVKENVTQTDIDAHVLALQTAMNALETLPAITPLDKSLLMERLEEAKAISNDEQTYTDPSFRALQEAIRLVETEMDSISTESELSQLLADLETALNGLTLVSSPDEGDQEGPVVPNEPDTDNQPEEDINGAEEEDHTANDQPTTPSEDQASSSTDDTTSDDDSTGHTLPNTATNMYLFVMLGLMLICSGVMVFTYTKKKRAS
ncbi:family 16 glycosylhydrolase [Halolactibacillus sp. JCM 19043]|uniref:family 16 glycosylhydrolase n=1 Tax=Halolactibacillus sp. JCM 19043 TaxID=1460638 RepID=UPI000A439A72|nr:family 16 glycosylhydrolase [Halolactibacillus sp. JCM 19043]